MKEARLKQACFLLKIGREIRISNICQTVITAYESGGLEGKASLQGNEQNTVMYLPHLEYNKRL